MDKREKVSMADIRYIKLVSVGSVNPNSPVSDQSRYMLGEHELTMERTTYHIGFERKPVWEDEKKEG